MVVRLPWGAHDALDLHLPPEWSVEGVHSPDSSHPIADYASELNRALHADPLLRDLRPGTRVAIVVDDNSRWTPVQEALSVLLPHLHGGGVQPEDITISIAVGRHRAMDDVAIRHRVGERVAAQYRCFSPPLDDAVSYADLGTAADRIPVRVFRLVADAGLRVLIGSVLPHLQAGFGGGWKLIFPGTSHRTTLAALHRQGLGGDLGGLLGTNAADNPMRRAVSAAAHRLHGLTLSISHLLGPPGTVLQLGVGHPDDVQDQLAAAARRRFQAPEHPPADVVVVNSYPWPGDPMQSFKTLIHHAAACRPGGLLVGFFWTDPGEMDRSIKLARLRAVAAGGRAIGWTVKRGVSAAAWAMTNLSVPNAFMASWARELVADRTVLLYSPGLHERLGPWLGPVRIFSDQKALWDVACRLLASTAAVRVRTFPIGGLTYCPGAAAKAS